MNRLQNKVVVVTGAWSGVGRATAKLFAAGGAKVVVAARRVAELATLVAEIEADGGQAIALAGDVTSEAFNARLMAPTTTPAPWARWAGRSPGCHGAARGRAARSLRQTLYFSLYFLLFVSLFFYLARPLRK